MYPYLAFSLICDESDRPVPPPPPQGQDILFVGGGNIEFVGGGNILFVSENI